MSLKSAREQHVVVAPVAAIFHLMVFVNSLLADFTLYSEGEFNGAPSQWKVKSCRLVC